MTDLAAKSASLLAFLRALAGVRQKRQATWKGDDRQFWMADLPPKGQELRSPFLGGDRGEDEIWLEIRKPTKPNLPEPPEPLQVWLEGLAEEDPDKPPRLKERRLRVVRRQIVDPETGESRIHEDEVAEGRADYPQIDEQWRRYQQDHWLPWADKARRWRALQKVYEAVDFMRRRIEEAEERFELQVGVGLLEWRDPSGTTVRRHVVTAAASIELEASRGVLRVRPAPAFDGLRIELDMLDPAQRPELRAELAETLEEIDVRLWDQEALAPVLRAIGNKLHAGSRIDADGLRPESQASATPRLSWAPALLLRERRPTAYDELVARLGEQAAKGELALPPPLRQYLLEGNVDPDGAGGHGASGGGVGAPERCLFPLAANDEQRQIIDRLAAQPCVLVKGPPGTGKSQTIANLVSHLLAAGERVLVTAHAPKALTVLRDKLPKGIRALSVTSLGGAQDDRALLQESVQAILERQDRRATPEQAAKEIAEIEGKLRAFEYRVAELERELREIREAETHRFERPGYRGTAAVIARAAKARDAEFAWFAAAVPADAAFPLDPSEVALLAARWPAFDDALRAELEGEVGEGALPDAAVFSALVERLAVCEELAARAASDVAAVGAESLRACDSAELRALSGAIDALDRIEARARRALGARWAGAIDDLRHGGGAVWRRQVEQSDELLRSAEARLGRLDKAEVTWPAAAEPARLLADVERRLEHLRGGGRRGWWVFTPKPMRETRASVESCLVDGMPAETTESLAKVADALRLRRELAELRVLWPQVADQGPAALQVADLRERTAVLAELVEAFGEGPLKIITEGNVPADADLTSADVRGAWRRGIAGLEAAGRLAEIAGEWRALAETVGRVRGNHAPHPVIDDLRRALEARDVEGWRAARSRRDDVIAMREDYARLRALRDRLAAAAPAVGALIDAAIGDEAWAPRLAALPEAWRWAAAKAWLARATGTGRLEAVTGELRYRREEIERQVSMLVEAKAWRAFLERLDARTIQSLKGWEQAVKKIGKGTGKNAAKHRQTARKYLQACVPAIPAWIMPLHKLWESAKAEAGQFDTIIIDEASQAGTEALVLLAMARRVIVVGDDMQNSPEGVGIESETIHRLQRTHLGAFHFGNLYEPTTSLFDHAHRAFEAPITLREHFRCVPEIIRFCNQNFYRDVPLIPLRQPPPRRLPPLRTQFVAAGRCLGKDSRIHNPAEAEAIVDKIADMVEDPAYAGKSIGVVALQGHAQAERIAMLLAQRLEPRVIEARAIRCGEPATFQGDERDVILLSMIVSPEHRIAARTSDPDMRRYNVAVSRARDQLWLFHSVPQEDLSKDDLRAILLRYMLDPSAEAREDRAAALEALERAAHGTRTPGGQPQPFDSWFEVDVALMLMRREYRVRPQVDAAGYRIDLVIEDGEQRLAIECDGDHWHGPERFDADMARQRQLERAGWVFARIRESDFYADPERAVAAVIKACEERDIWPVNAPRPSRSSVPSGADRGFDGAGAFARSDVDSLGVDGSESGPPMLDDRDLIAPYGAENDPTPTPVEPEDEHDDEDASAPHGGAEGRQPVLPMRKPAVVGAYPDPAAVKPAELRKILFDIIAAHGPLMRKTLIRLYLAGCPDYQRAGKTFKSMLNKAVFAMLRDKTLADNNDLGICIEDEHVVRVAGAPAVVVRGAEGRDLTEIPPGELAAVFDELDATPGKADADTAFRRLIEYYGFQRLTGPRRDYLTRVWTRIPRGILQAPGG